MRVLVACEFSGAVRSAFRARGHEAWSCDLLPAEDGSPFHLQCDVIPVLDYGWDLLIAFPPCTDLAVSGARWFAAKGRARQDAALAFVARLMACRVPLIAIENPVGIIATHLRPADQIIQPWQFGCGEVKATCLWLKGLPRLTPTAIVAGRAARVHRMPPSPTRGLDRARTYPGIAAAMADQWGQLPEFSLRAPA